MTSEVAVKPNKRRPLLLVTATGVLFVFLFLGVALLYFYSHPPAARPFIERSLSRLTGTSVRIQSISYSLRPLSLEAQGITMRPRRRTENFRLDISRARLGMSLIGPFGKRTLVLRDLSITGFCLKGLTAGSLPLLLPGETEPSLMGRFLGGMVHLFLFRKIRFETVTAENGEVVLEDANHRVQMTGIQAEVNKERLVEISSGLLVQWRGEKRRLSLPRLQVTTPKGISLSRPQVRFFVRSEGGLFEDRKGGLRIRELSGMIHYDPSKGVAKIRSVDLKFGSFHWDSPKVEAGRGRLKGSGTYVHKTLRLTFEDLEVSMEEVVYSPIRPKRPLHLHLHAGGSMDLNRTELRVPRFEFQLGRVLEAVGTLTGQMDPRPQITFHFTKGELISGEAFSLISKPKKGPEGFSFSGPVEFQGRMIGSREGANWKWVCKIRSRVERERISYGRQDTRFDALLKGEILVEGTPPHLQISATLKGGKSSFRNARVKTGPSTWALSLSGKYPDFRIREMEARIPSAGISLSRKHLLRIKDISVKSEQGRFNAQKKSLALSRIALDSSLLKNLNLSFTYGAGRGVLGIRGEQIGMTKSVASLGLIPRGWQVSAGDRMAFRGTLGKEGALSLEGSLDLRGLSFEDPQGVWAGEDIAVHLELKVKSHLRRPGLEGEVGMKLGKGEALYDRFYLDLRKNPLLLKSSARYDSSQRHLEISKLSLRLQDILSLASKGTYDFGDPSSRKADLRINIPAVPLRPLFHDFVVEPFGSEKPFLEDLKVGGTVSGDLKLRDRGGRRSVIGRFSWRDGLLKEGTKGVELKGIHMDLPIWYDPTRMERRGKGLEGHLSVGSMALPGIPVQPLRLELQVAPGSVMVDEPTSLRMQGGKVRIGSIRARRLFWGDRSVQTSVTLEDLDLAPWLSRVWHRPVNGMLKGHLGSVRYAGGRLHTEGQLRVHIFGGEILLSRLGASGLFTPSLAFRLDAELQDLDLKAATGGTSFGKIEGVLRGYVRGLEIAYGQPQRFDLLLETVKRKGVRQRISLKAVDNIARIGGGNSPFMGLAGGFASFFKEFPYRKIGIRATLENDVFRVNGTVVEGGKEYLIKRGGFSGVNVINQNPDNRIRFRDMVKRIRRITSGTGGPIIK